MIVLDTSALFAALDETQPAHQPARRVLESEDPPLVLSPFVLAELDYLVTTRVGVREELAVLSDVTTGAYELASFGASDVGHAHAVIARYRDLGIGLTDASIVVLAARLRTNRIFTLDQRHFRALRTPDGEHFTLLPAGA